MRSLPLWCLAAVPLVCALLASAWGCGGSGMMPGRAAVALLLAGCLLATARAGRTQRTVWSWRAPATWCAAALAWQGLALVGWTIRPEPGLLLWGERVGALFTAIGLAAWCRDQEPLAQVRAVVAAGAGVLVLGVLGQLPVVAGGPAGADLPFGNPNFNVGGALPLLGLAVPFLRDRVVAVLAAGGLAAAVVLGLGLRVVDHHLEFLDKTRSVWIGLPAMLGVAVILRLPTRSHGWIVAIGELAVLAVLIAGTAGMMPLPGFLNGPSSGQRLALWNCAVEAIVQAPLWGGGPGSAIVALQEQVSSPLAWMLVPSYAEHPHNEYLNALLDGGLIGVALLGAGLFATLVPLWRRRNDVLCGGLLISWSGVLTLALIESHLSQPGPLLLLAILAGVTWAVTWAATAECTVEISRKRYIAPLLAGLAAVLLLVQIMRDFMDGGSPSMIERRASLRMTALAGDWPARAVEAERVRARLGNLDTWLSIEAEARARGRDPAAAKALALAQIARLPVDATALDLLLRFRDRQRIIGQEAEAERLTVALHAAQVRATQVLALVPDNPLNHQRREQLAAVLERIDQIQ